ncbi:hypothetical protein V8E55_007042 [Tylopilus felleus]
MPLEHINTISREGKRPRSDSHPNTSPPGASPAVVSESDPPPQPLCKCTHHDQSITPVITPTHNPSPHKPLHFNKMPKSSTGTNTLDSGLTITATPESGFPTPQLGDAVWQNVAQRLKIVWPTKKGGKAWVQVFRGYYQENAQEMVEKFCEIIPKIVGKDNAKDLVISTPSAETDMLVCLPPPYHFLISGLDNESIKTLTDLGLCSTKDLTCFFVPFKQPLPMYVGTLENFSLPDSANSNCVIAEIVKTTLRATPDVTAFIHSNIPAPDANTAVAAIDSIRITSLWVSTSKIGKRTVWNIYCDSPPAFSLETYYNWTKKIRTISFPSDDNGIGTMRLGERQFMCTGCKSFDHPTWACPFTCLPRWFSPPPTSEEATTMMENKSSRKGGRNMSFTRGRGQITGGFRRTRGRT